MHIVYDDGNPANFNQSRDFPEPNEPIVEGDVCVVRRPFVTFGKETYNVGDHLHIVARTNYAPHNRRASTGNLVVRGKNGKLTVWTNIELCLYEGTLVRL